MACDEEEMPASPPPSAPPGPAWDAAAIRCRDLAAMTAFYADIVGLEPVEGAAPEDTVMLRTGEGFGPPARHVALVAAEDDEDEPAPAPHHLALTVPGAEALERARAWFRAHGLATEIAEHAWAGWKCLTVTDPEGNTVELAAPVRQRTLPADAAGRG